MFHKEATEPRIHCGYVEVTTLKVAVTTMNCLTAPEYQWRKWPRCFTFRVTIQSFPHAWPITGIVARRVPLVKQELPSLLEHPSTPLVFGEDRVVQSLVFCLMLCRLLLILLPFLFVHCIVCPSSMYGFRLSLTYLWTLLSIQENCVPPKPLQL